MMAQFLPEAIIWPYHVLIHFFNQPWKTVKYCALAVKYRTGVISNISQFGTIIEIYPSDFPNRKEYSAFIGQTTCLYRFVTLKLVGLDL